MTFLQRFGGNVLVVGCKGPVGLQGDALRSEVKKFAGQMRPHLAAAEKMGMTIALENHAGTIIETPDAIRWLAEFTAGQPMGIALAPYHLEQNAPMLAGLIRDLGPKLALFYGWQYGVGCMKVMPEDQETLQLPGRGNLDFTPLLQALKDIRFAGWTEIFMHHTPRGLPPFPTVPPITAELVRAHDYLTARLATLQT
jgi:sugar phosphate isomerase/epimerase